MKAVCPRSVEHKLFSTTAHEVHDWLVKSDGSFVSDLGCLETTSEPDSANTWVCYICGTEAVVE